MLIFCEFLKIVKNKAVFVVIAILLVANSVVVLSYVSERNNEFPIGLDEVWSQFHINPKSVLKRFDELEQFYDERKESLLEERAGKGAYSALAIIEQEKAADAEYYALKLVREKVDAAISFPKTIRDIIQQAESNRDLLHEGLTDDDNTFGLLYQNRVIRQYNAVQINVRIGVDDLRGWESYFQNTFTGIAVLFTTVLVAGIAAGLEYDTNATPLLYSTKNGRRKHRGARMLAVNGTLVLLVLLTEAETFGLIALVQGFGWGGNAIQALAAFRTCPYVLTIWQSAAVWLSVRILLILVMGTLTQFLADLCQSGVAASAGGTLCTGALSILTLSPFTGGGTNSLLRLTGNAVLRTPFPFFERFLVVNLSDTVVDGLEASSVFLGILIAVFTVLDSLFCRRVVNSSLSGQLRKQLGNVRKMFRRCSKKHGFREGSISLPRHELYKTFIASRALWGVILLLVVYGIQMIHNENTDRSYYADVYDYYVDSIHGEWTIEKETFIREKVGAAKASISGMEITREKYLNKMISREEYRQALEQCNEAYLELPALEELADYLEDMHQRSDEGYKVTILNDTRWSRVVRKSIDWTMVTMAFVIALASFGEYTKHDPCDISSIRTCAKFGRKKTELVKSFSGLTACAILYTIQRLSWLLYSMAALPKEDRSAIIMSIRVMGHAAHLGLGSISIYIGLWLIGIVQCVYIILLFLCFSASLVRLRNKYAAIAATLFLFVIPILVK